MSTKDKLRLDGAKTFTAFAAAGSVGFAVDVGVLAALVHFAGIDPYVARALSIAIAVTATWSINRRLAFAASASADKVAELSRYFAVSMVGSGVNFGIYSLCIFMSDFMYQTPVSAVAIASAIALAVNYQGAKRHVFNA